MRMFKQYIGIVFGLLLTLGAWATPGPKTFDSIVIFGDSLSDNGNLYRYFLHYLPASPPYYEGRFSNGLLWIDRLYSSSFSGEYQTGYQNYAVGGAGAVLSYKENLPFTLTAELDDYFYWNKYGHQDTSLFVIWIGANNYVNGPTNAESITNSVVEAISGSVEKLINRGGNKFLIANLPDLGLIPHSTDRSDKELISHLTRLHNQKLAIAIDILKAKYPDVTFVSMDTYEFFNDAVANPEKFGLTNVTEACYLGGFWGEQAVRTPSDKSLLMDLQQQQPQFSDAQWALINNNPDLKEAILVDYQRRHYLGNGMNEPGNCDTYFFWDHLHPTTAVHALIAKKVETLLTEAGLQAIMPPPTENK